MLHTHCGTDGDCSVQHPTCVLTGLSWCACTGGVVLPGSEWRCRRCCRLWPGRQRYALAMMARGHRGSARAPTAQAPVLGCCWVFVHPCMLPRRIPCWCPLAAALPRQALENACREADWMRAKASIHRVLAEGWSRACASHWQQSAGWRGAPTHPDWLRSRRGGCIVCGGKRGEVCWWAPALCLFGTRQCTGRCGWQDLCASIVKEQGVLTRLVLLTTVQHMCIWRLFCHPCKASKSRRQSIGC